MAVDGGAVAGVAVIISESEVEVYWAFIWAVVSYIEVEVAIVYWRD